MILGRRDDLSVMLVDLDSFSKINDTYGCPTADSLLQHLGTEIARSMRPLDHVARIDADQYALLLPKTQAMGGKVVAERIALWSRFNHCNGDHPSELYCVCRWYHHCCRAKIHLQ